MYVSVKTAAAIAITAAEGGIGYWSQIDHYDWKKIEASKNRWETFFNLHVINDDEDGYEKDGRAIDAELIQRGVDLFLTGVPNNFEGRCFSDDLDCIDSAEADCVIQLGLFGKLIFG